MAEFSWTLFVEILEILQMKNTHIQNPDNTCLLY
jgi:hypothetical protein